MYLREHQHENGWTIDQSKEHPFALPFGRDSSSQIDIAIFSNIYIYICLYVKHSPRLNLTKQNKNDYFVSATRNACRHVPPIQNNDPRIPVKSAASVLVTPNPTRASTS